MKTENNLDIYGLRKNKKTKTRKKNLSRNIFTEKKSLLYTQRKTRQRWQEKKV